MTSYLKQNPLQEWLSYLIGSEPYRYHCWHRSLEHWYAQGRIYRTYGTINLTVGMVFFISSSLVLWAFRSHSLMKSSCFKILFFLGIVAWAEVLTMSIWPAFLLFRGATFCTHPRFGIIAGRALTMEWVAGSSACSFLMLNRLADMTRNKNLIKFFDRKKKVTGTFIVILIYSLLMALLTDPCLYNSSRRGFSMDPFNQMEPELFENLFIVIHNIFFVVYLLAVFSFVLYKLFTEYENCWRGTSDLQRKILIQSALACVQYVAPCFIYLIIFLWNTYEPPKCFIEGTHVWFQMMSGMNGVLCLMLNRPIRVKLLEKMGMKHYIVQPKRRIGAPSITRSIM